MTNEIKTRIDAAKQMRYDMRSYDSVFFDYSPNTKKINIVWTNGLNIQIDGRRLSNILGVLLPDTFGVIGDNPNSSYKVAELLNNGQGAYSIIEEDLKLEYFDEAGKVDLDTAKEEALSWLWILLPLLKTDIKINDAFIGSYFEGLFEETSIMQNIALLHSIRNI